SAVVSFAVDDVTVNLIDTPGHPDFIAEVERILSVLDGAVLVISAVEGVQSQTRVLMRALGRLQIPTLLFVNKVDRMGADCERVLNEISERLTRATVAMASVAGQGTRAAVVRAHPDGDLVDALAEHDDALLAAYLDDETSVSSARLRDTLAVLTKQALVHPAFFGSALTGAGVDSVMAGLAELLARDPGDPDGSVSGMVFKIERGSAGGKVAYVRMFSGTVHVRDRLGFGREREQKVTAISVFDDGTAVQRPSVSAGEIAKLSGLGEIQIGDSIGAAPGPAMADEFPPPTLESVVVASKSDERARLRVALEQLAEQDPLINVRQDDGRREIAVSLYGEVQKEVIQATLASDYGIDVTFRETTPICVERPVGTGEAVENLHAESNPFLAAMGLRVDPTPYGSGVEFRVQVDSRTVPLYIYKTLESFTEHMDQYVREALREGSFGWQVTDCVVTMTRCVYSVPDGPPSRRGPLSTAADFRKLTPLVLRQALERAGTVVCEPTVRVSLEVPTDTVGAVMPALARLGAAVETPSLQGELSTIGGMLSAALADDLQQQLPALTRGEGVLESSFAGYQPVNGDQPTRATRRGGPIG
ncbi:MAG: TetM/TetW/TetO/TetS family tetracycline resistance ribosomal protection protein, partial [Actinobacteria bacterium]